MNILGISAFYHDSAAALITDGRIAAAAQEERFTRKKHDYSFPEAAVDYCLSAAHLDPSQIDYVVFYEKPLLKFDRLIETFFAFAPEGFRSFCSALPLWMKEKLYSQRELDKGLHHSYSGRYVYLEHHESHAASAFFPSPFEEAAIVTLDGVGEWATATIGIGKGNGIEILKELHFPHSLGLLYSAFTYYTGFRVNSGEYKLMGLAPYGRPKYADLITEKLIRIKPDGSFWMDMQYFNYCQGSTMINGKFEALFGQPARKPETPISEFHMDVAASIQQVTEEIMLKIARFAHSTTGMPNLCLAGGVALNCVGNGRILRDGPFDRIWIQPASGDAGGALGAALFTWYQLLGNPRQVQSEDLQEGSLLGPSFQTEEIENYLNGQGAVFEKIENDQALCDKVAQLIDEQNVVGWFQGRMEFGPRALGSRSILGDARSTKMQKTMNLKIKFRESFRPFAPVVLKERAGEFFDVPAAFDSPYMLIVSDVKEGRRRRISESESEAAGFGKLEVIRSEIPAVTHVDFSARIQTVDAGRHGRFHRLMEAVAERTGCPVLINTSFNVRGEPIVCTPEDAYRCFMATNMDVLVLENLILLKAHQPAERIISPSEHLSQFALD